MGRSSVSVNAPWSCRQKVECLFHTEQKQNKTNKHRVPTQPGKMREHLENLEISWNFEKFNKYHGKMT